MLPLLLACIPAQPPDIVLITWDTVRADRVGVQREGKSLTPTWDALAAEGWRFSSARTPAPITLPAHASVMTGRLPPHHRARDNGRFTLTASLPTLAEDATAAGYATAGFVSASVLSAASGIGRGFSVFDDDYTPDVLPYRRGDRTVDAALDWLRSVPADQPVMLWVHLFDAHRPWHPTRSAWERAGRDAYQAEIGAVDAQTARLMEAIRARQTEAVAVVAADHGEGLGEHGEQTHTWFAYDSTVRVPLLLWWSDTLTVGQRGAVIDGPASLIDIAPTLRALTGLPVRETDGIDLTAGALPARTLTVETVAPKYILGAAPVFGAIDADGKSWYDLPTPEHYDLTTDPDQQHNRYTPSHAALLQAAIDRASRSWPQDAAAIDTETAAALEALGYISSAAQTDDALVDPKDRLDLFNLLSTPRDQHPPATALAKGQAMRARYGLSPELARYLADCFDALGQVQAADAVLAEAVERWPEETRLEKEHAQRTRQRAHSLALVPAIEQAIAAGTAPPSALFDLGVTLRYLERLDDAAAALEQAIAQDPTDAEAHRQLAGVRRSQGDIPAALAVLLAAPTTPAISCERGRLRYLFLDEHAQAAADLHHCWDGGARMSPADLAFLSTQ